MLKHSKSGSWQRLALCLGLAMSVGQVFAQATVAEPAKPSDASTTISRPQADAERQASIRFGEPDARARTPQTLRIASYNLLNFFDSDPVTRPHSEGSPAPIKPKEERQAAADAIRAIDADVVAVQEIESLEVLKRFRDEYLAGMGYEHAVLIESEDPRGIDNAVLSRFPIVHSETYATLDLGGVQPAMEGNRPNPLAGEPMRFRRSPLRADIEIPASHFGGTGSEGRRLTLFVVHHKSGRWSSYWREAEARGVVSLAEAVAKATPDAAVIVLGDFNAQTQDASVRTYLDNGFVDPFAGATGPSSVTHESGRRIDKVLLGGRARGAVVTGGSFVLGMPARPEGADWRTTPPPVGYASDHYPVVVDLRDPAAAAKAEPEAKTTPN